MAEELVHYRGWGISRIGLVDEETTIWATYADIVWLFLYCLCGYHSPS
jgi:hypothetical protein